MKRSYLLSTALAFLFFFAACGRSSETNSGKKAAGNIVTAIFDTGNYYLDGSERSPVSVQFELPEGWTVAKGVFDGIAYYPDEELKGNSLIGRYGNAERTYSVYDKEGKAVGALVYASMIWTDELKEELGFDAMTSEEKLGKEIEIVFSEFRGSLSSLVLNGDNSRTVSATDDRSNSVCETIVTSTADESGNKMMFSCPAAAAYDSKTGIGCFMEFAPEAVSFDQAATIAESIIIMPISQ